MGAGGPIRRSIVKNSDAYSQAGKRQVALIGAGDRIVAGVHPEGEPRIDPVDLIDVDSHQIVGPDLVAPGAFDPATGAYRRRDRVGGQILGPLQTLRDTDGGIGLRFGREDQKVPQPVVTPELPGADRIVRGRGRAKRAIEISGFIAPSAAGAKIVPGQKRRRRKHRRAWAKYVAYVQYAVRSVDRHVGADAVRVLILAETHRVLGSRVHAKSRRRAIR